MNSVELKFKFLTDSEMQERATKFEQLMSTRRTVRDFSNKAVPRKLIEDCLLTAGSAPSGANRQPWHFAVVSSPIIKQKIRAAAELEEKEFYTKRAPQDWLDALAPLGTDADKPFLERAPYLVVIFGQKYQVSSEGKKYKNCDWVANRWITQCWISHADPHS